MRVIANENNVKLYGTIWDGDGEYIAEKIAEQAAIYPRLHVHLSTSGGSVFDGDLIYNALNELENPVDMYIDGLAASMGSILMLPARKIYMARNAFVMTHAPTGGTFGPAKAHEGTANLLRKMETNFLRKWAARMNKTEEECKPLLDGDNWFSAEDCLKMGMIDGIIDDVFKTDDIVALKTMKVAAYAKGNDPFELANSSTPSSKEHTKQDLQTNKTKMKKNLITACGFLATANVTEESSDTAVSTAINNHVDALTKRAETAEVALATLKTANEEAEKAAISAVVKTAHKLGKITAEQIPTFEGIGEKSGIAALNAAFGAILTRTPLHAAVTAVASELEGKSWDKMQEEDPRALELLQKENPEQFSILYKAKFNKEFQA